MEKIVFERASFKVTMTLQASAQHLALLNKTTVGSEGAQYLHKNIAERLGQMQHQYWMNVIKDDRLMGTFCTAHRVISSPFGKVNAYYVRYFAFRETIQASKSTHRNVKSPEGIFKKFTQRFFSKPPYELGLDFGEDRSLPYLNYAYIDSENLRSSNMSEMFGFRSMSTFETLAFTRLYPSNYSEVELLKKEEYATMRETLCGHYKEFSFFDEQYLFIKDNYLVWRENGEIVAGVQVNKSEWEMKHVSGMTGKILLNVVPYTPYIRRFFNPKKFEFVTFDYLFHKPGFEDRIEKLLCAAMNRNKVSFSLNWHEIKSPYYDFFKNKADRGFLAKFSNVPPAHYMVSASGVTEEQYAALKASPLFMCGMDMS